MLELDGPVRPIVEQLRERTAMSGLVVLLTAEFLEQHGEVVGDDCFDLELRPILGHGAPQAMCTPSERSLSYPCDESERLSITADRDGSEARVDRTRLAARIS
jgi:hypothetical protein